MTYFIFILITVVFVGIIVFRWWYNLPEQKGKRGEQKVNDILKQLPSDYYVINDLILKTHKGTTQIDHVVISRFGIFAIETKNYRGVIYGDDNRQQWTQKIVTEVTYMRKLYKTYTYVTKSSLYNPVKQSLGHAYVIKKNLSEWGNLNVVPIVVFSGNVDLRNVYSSYHVIYLSNLLSTIQNYRTEFFSESDVQSIVNKLSEKNLKGIIDDNTHIHNVYSAKNEFNQKVANGICPKCGGSLVQRSGRYGRFYGCSNYPKCKFTVK